MTLAPGSRLGSHEIVGLLGAGGMGEVYRALDTRLNRQVAIKVLPEPFASDPERVARFHREAQAVAALNHPGIATIHELTESPAEGTAPVKFLVLELVEGETLAERLRRGPVPVEEALAIARQILEALEAAHERGICHRDLKPANIKLTSTGGGAEPPRVKVLDFGLAKFLQSGPAAANLANSPTLSVAGTFPGVVLGTAGYMSPEQARGFEADQRSDIFSFGCVLYELLAGRQAFDGETASDILAGVLKLDVDFALLPRRLNPRLVEVLKRCLEKNPKKRWHAAADVRVELESLTGRALAADEPQAIAAPARPLWQRAAALLAAALAGAAVAGYAAWTLKPETPRTVSRFRLGLPEGETFSNAGRQVVGLSPDGRTLAYVANQRLYVRSLSALDTRDIPGSAISAGLLNPVFSPDGQSLAFYSRGDGTLKRIPVSGGTPITICSATDPYGLSWSGDGLVFGQLKQGIVRVADTGGVPEVIAAVTADEMASNPQMLPGGRAVLFSVKKRSLTWDTGSVVAQTLGGGARKVLLEGGADGRYVASGHLLYGLSGVMFAVPFDVATLEVRGGRVAVVEGVSRGGLFPNSTGTMHVSVSDTGSLAYVPGPAKLAASEGWDLAVFDRKGTFQPLKLTSRLYQSPRVSPDGRWVVVDSNDETESVLWVFDVTGAVAERPLTFRGRNQAPVWSPDGQWIAYQSDRDKDLGIFRQRWDGTGEPERLTTPPADAAHLPDSWSPDGAVLLFSERKGNRYSLMALSLKDRTTRPVAGVGSSVTFEAAFSPDGRWIAYQSRDDNGPMRSFVQQYPAGGKYLVPHAGGHPFWSRKGTELILNAGPVQSAAIAVTTSPRFEFGQPVVFSRSPRNDANPSQFRRAADILPDGERVLGRLSPSTTTVGSRENAIVVVVNWLDELRQRVR